MTMKRTRGSNNVDLALPVAPYYRTDPQVLKDVENMRMNATSRWMKDDHSRTFSRFNAATDDTSSKSTELAQPKLEILRANSPTLKRLVAARLKLEKYANSISRTITASRISTLSQRQTPYPNNSEKQSTVVSQPSTQPPPPPPLPPPPPPAKQVTSSSNQGDRPLDKITYEKTWSMNGYMKQKCSLEIWLPKPGLDDDDDGASSSNRTEKISQTAAAVKSRRSSIVKVVATTTQASAAPPILNSETKSIDEVASKKSDPVLVPRVYHYGDYIMDIPDERPRSSKSVTTVKSDSASSVKSIRRQYVRSAHRRLSGSSRHSEEILRFRTVEVPKSAKTTNTKSSNPAMINELMQKYSLLKKDHQELTQMKLQLEKPTNESKINPKDLSPRSRPPPIPDSTALVPSDKPSISVKKLIIDTSQTRPLNEQPSHTNTKLLERRATPQKPSHSEIYPHLRIFSLVNQQQHRRASGSLPNSLLPNVSSKKTDEITRTLQRSKTLDVVLDIPNSSKVKSRQSNQPDNSIQQQQRQRSAKRSAFNHRSSTTIPTNTVLIHFNHTNTERNYLVPE